MNRHNELCESKSVWAVSCFVTLRKKIPQYFIFSLLSQILLCFIYSGDKRASRFWRLHSPAWKFQYYPRIQIYKGYQKTYACNSKLIVFEIQPPTSQKFAIVLDVSTSMQHDSNNCGGCNLYRLPRLGTLLISDIFLMDQRPIIVALSYQWLTMSLMWLFKIDRYDSGCWKCQLKTCVDMLCELFSILDRTVEYTFNKVKLKHCQRHNGPEGWVHLAKLTSWSHITSSNTNLDHIFRISTKHQLKISTNLKVQNLGQT